MQIRAMTTNDLKRVGEIMFKSFNEINARYHHPPEFDSVENARAVAAAYLANEPDSGIVADNGRVVGCGFVRIRGERASAGPFAVDPAASGLGIGRLILEEEMRRVGERALVGMQVAFNREAYSVLTRFGYDGVDSIARLRRPLGPSDAPTSPHVSTTTDVALVAEIDRRLTGAERTKDFELVSRMGRLFVWSDGGRPRGFLAAVAGIGSALLGPGSAETPEILEELIATAEAMLAGVRGIHVWVPTSLGDVIRALFKRNYQLHYVQLIMARGAWSAPKVPYLVTQFPESF